MCIAIKRSICKTQNHKYPRGRGAADSLSIAGLNVLRNALTNGRPHSLPMLSGDWFYSEGEKGLLAADYLHAQVWVWDGKEEKARCWHILVRREVGADVISHYCLSNAPLDTS